MSDSADEGDFHPHPGDPWHPEWTEEAAAGEIADVGDAVAEGAKKTRRGLFRRRRLKAAEAEAPAQPPESDVTQEAGEGAEDVPAGVLIDHEPPVVEIVPERSVVVDPATELYDAPLPAWLSEIVPAAAEDVALPVEPPTWVGGTTEGAHGVAGGFEAASGLPLEPEEPVPTPDDVAVALRAIGELAENVEVVPIDEEAEQESLFEAFPRGPAAEFPPLGPLPETTAADGGYGVAPKEAFEALRQIHDEDLGDWEAFAEAAEGPLETPPVASPGRQRMPADVSAEERPEPEGFADWVDQEPTRRRGIWPFRRRRVPPDDIDLSDEPAEWVGDAGSVPEDWFAEVDEDIVVPPPPYLPETEWPEPEPVATPTVEPSGWEVPLSNADRAASDGFPAADDVIDESHVEEIAVDLPGIGPTDESGEYPPIEFDHGYGFDQIETSAAEPSIPGGGGSKLSHGGDDLSVPPAKPAADHLPGEDEPADNRDDEWVIDPIEVGAEIDDATVELPVDYASADDITEQMYTTSATMEHRGFAAELSQAGDEDTEWQAISAAMPGVGTGVVGFDDVADLGDEEDVYEEPTRSELGTRVVTGVVLVGFLVASVWVGGAAAAIFIGVLTMLGLGEFYGTVRHRGFRPLALFGYLGGVSMLAAAWFHGPIAIPVAIGLTTVVVFFVYAFAPLRRDALTNGGLTVVGITWVAGTIAFVEPILRVERYRVLVLAVVVVTAGMDIGAYSVGRTWGRRALAPILSPNKSVEGLLGGIVVCMGVAAAIGYLVEPFDLRSGLALGLVVCLVAPIGDLAESMMKRSLGVKDMGAVLPGHGGILDRIDAFLFVVPAAWILFETIGLLG